MGYSREHGASPGTIPTPGSHADLQDEDLVPQQLRAPDLLPRLLGLTGQPVARHLHVAVHPGWAAVRLGLHGHDWAGGASESQAATGEALSPAPPSPSSGCRNSPQSQTAFGRGGARSDSPDGSNGQIQVLPSPAPDHYPSPASPIPGGCWSVTVPTDPALPQGLWARGLCWSSWVEAPTRQGSATPQAISALHQGCPGDTAPGDAAPGIGSHLAAMSRWQPGREGQVEEATEPSRWLLCFPRHPWDAGQCWPSPRPAPPEKVSQPRVQAEHTPGPDAPKIHIPHRSAPGPTGGRRTHLSRRAGTSHRVARPWPCWSSQRPWHHPWLEAEREETPQYCSRCAEEAGAELGSQVSPSGLKHSPAISASDPHGRETWQWTVTHLATQVPSHS